MGRPIRLAEDVNDPSEVLWKAILAFDQAVTRGPADIAELEHQRGNAAIEAAAENAVLELLCEHRRGHEVAAVLAEFRSEGSRTRSRCVRMLERLRSRYRPGPVREGPLGVDAVETAA